MPLFLLVHSPSVGPSTWQPVADELCDLGHDAVVPSLLEVGVGEAPYWPKVPAAVRDALHGRCEPEPVILVVHSNAGLFVPVITSELRRPVACSIFADASIPPAAGSTPVAETEFVPFLRGLAESDGRLPPWTSWWGDEDLAALLPDPLVRAVIVAEQPRLPLEYYLEQVPLPAGWDDRPCAYLHFSKAYDGQAEEARGRGWPVRTVAGEHLHQVVDPPGVARALLDLAAEAG